MAGKFRGKRKGEDAHHDLGAPGPGVVGDCVPGVRLQVLPSRVTETAAQHGPQGGGGASPCPAPPPPPSPPLPAPCSPVPRAARSQSQAGIEGLPSPRTLTTTLSPIGPSRHRGQRKPGHLRAQVRAERAGARRAGNRELRTGSQGLRRRRGWEAGAGKGWRRWKWEGIVRRGVDLRGRTVGCGVGRQNEQSPLCLSQRNSGERNGGAKEAHLMGNLPL